MNNPFSGLGQIFRAPGGLLNAYSQAWSDYGDMHANAMADRRQTPVQQLMHETSHGAQGAQRGFLGNLLYAYSKGWGDYLDPMRFRPNSAPFQDRNDLQAFQRGRSQPGGS